MAKVIVEVEIPDGFKLVSRRARRPKFGEHYLYPVWGKLAVQRASFDFEEEEYLIVEHAPIKARKRRQRA